MNLYETHNGEPLAGRRLIDKLLIERLRPASAPASVFVLISALTSGLISGIVGCNRERDDSPERTHPPFCGGAPYAEHVECARPWLPHIDQVPLGGRWLISHPERQTARVGVSSDPEAQEPAHWLDTPELVFDQIGHLKVFVEVDPSATPCEPQRFSRVYEVVEGYSAHAGSPDSDAISMDDPRLIEWAEEIDSVRYGANVSELFQDEARVLGPAQGGALDALSLGSGGEVTLHFQRGIANGPGPDFAIFENSFNDRFLELARVDVSTDGVSFVSIPHAYLGEETLGAFGEHDPALIDGLAGKHRAGYGTPFDLSTLAWSPEAQEGVLDLHAIHYVRVVDIVGDGSVTDSFQRPIYDPFPTQGSAGADLDAIGVIYTSDDEPCPL